MPQLKHARRFTPLTFLRLLRAPNTQYDRWFTSFYSQRSTHPHTAPQRMCSISDPAAHSFLGHRTEGQLKRRCLSENPLALRSRAELVDGITN